MATQPIIEVDSLLQVISEEAPSGSDIREDTSATSLYQQIKAARNQARAAERQSVHDGESTEATQYWQQVIALAPQMLSEQSKDLEVASWYAEAMIRQYGFAGLRDSFRLIEGLIDTYWDTLFPMPDEYGIETRVSCLSGLNGEGAEGVLIAPIRKVTITGSDNPGPFSLWQYHQALETQKASDEQERADKIQKLGFGMDDIAKSVENSSESFFVDIRDDLSECIASYRNIGQKLDERCGIHEAPPTRTIVEVLEECLGVVKHIGKAKFPVEDDEIEAHGSEATENATDSERQGSQMNARGPVTNREDAFKQLLEIADFFRKTEPHSPVSYVLQKAVKWGNMPLGELINELIHDDSTRARYSELTGVNVEDQS